MNAVGGLYVVPPSADPQEVRTEVRSRGIRALEVQVGVDVDVMRDLPLEFLVLQDTGSVEALATLPGLRGLHVGSWSGELDFDALPLLEWFGTTEIEQGQLEPLLERHRPRLHHLAVGRYRFSDATPLARLTQLTHLAIGDSRNFTSLRGLRNLPHLRHLSVYLCPKLESLAEVTEATGLQHVEIASCNRITDLAPLADLLALRSIKIEARTPPSVAPLARHPRLEYLWIVSARRPDPVAIEALLDTPHLRLIATGRRCWLRGDGAWEHVPDIYAMNEAQTLLHERLVNEWYSVSAW